MSDRPTPIQLDPMLERALTAERKLAEARVALEEIVRDFNFCADESPNSFCSRACADVAKQALARIDGKTKNTEPPTP